MRKRLRVLIIPGFCPCGEEIYRSLLYSTYYEPIRRKNIDRLFWDSGKVEDAKYTLAEEVRKLGVDILYAASIEFEKFLEYNHYYFEEKKSVFKKSLSQEIEQDLQAGLSELVNDGAVKLDCFTNLEGKLVLSLGMEFKKEHGANICRRIENDALKTIAEEQNDRLKPKGFWSLWLKRQEKGFSLRNLRFDIDPTHKLWRSYGVNFPRLHLDTLSGMNVEKILINSCKSELALYDFSNYLSTDLIFDRIYIDYDDTVTINTGEKIVLNEEAISLCIKCKNKGIPVILISKHDGDLRAEIKEFGIENMFSEVIHLERKPGVEKADYIEGDNPILLDDSFGERWKAGSILGINTFEPCMMEFL